MSLFQSSVPGIVLFSRQGYANNPLHSNAMAGTTTVPVVCRAGGNGAQDLVCEGVQDTYMTLVKSPFQ